MEACLRLQVGSLAAKEVEGGEKEGEEEGGREGDLRASPQVFLFPVHPATLLFPGTHSTCICILQIHHKNYFLFSSGTGFSVTTFQNLATQAAVHGQATLIAPGSLLKIQMFTASSQSLHSSKILSDIYRRV